MFFDANDHRNAMVLLAFNGDVLGGVQWADTRTGELCRINIDTGEVEHLKGTVDFIGESTEDSEFLAQRFDAVRARLNLPHKDWTYGQSPADDEQRNFAAPLLEMFARKVRKGALIVEDFQETMPHARFPLPGDGFKQVPTGQLSLTVKFSAVERVAEYEAYKATWSNAHPERVPEFLRSQREG